MRRAVIERSTTETAIRLALNVDGTGKFANRTGIRFLDHMLDLVARHGGFDLEVKATGDLDVDLLSPQLCRSGGLVDRVSDDPAVEAANYAASATMSGRQRSGASSSAWASLRHRSAATTPPGVGSCAPRPRPLPRPVAAAPYPARQRSTLPV